MEERATGLILRTRPLTDTSLIVLWLTPELGRVATVAKGARRANSPFRGKLDLFYLADFSFARSRRSDLHTLREIVLREPHEVLRRNLAVLRQAAYASLLIDQATETETPLPEIYGLMAAFLRVLCQHPPHILMAFAFEARLLDLLGLRPDIQQARLSAEVKRILQCLLDEEMQAMSRPHLSSAARTELAAYLHDRLVDHLGRPPKGRSVLFEHV